MPAVTVFRTDAPRVFAKIQTWSVTLAWVVRGTKMARIGGQMLTYEPGSALVVTGPATYSAEIPHADPEHPYLALSLRLPSETLVRALWAFRDAGHVPSGAPQAAVVIPAAPELEDALVRLCLTARDSDESRVLAPLCIEEIAFRLVRSGAAATLRDAVRRDGDPARIVRAMDYIRDHLAEPLTVAQVAAEVGMSASHFAHEFRGWTRTSPLQYLKTQRLEAARRLFLEHGLRVGEAARQVGYANPSAFTREFRAYFGSSPSHIVRMLLPRQDRHEFRQKPALVAQAMPPTF